jgi:type I restriction enzyme, R subunit
MPVSPNFSFLNPHDSQLVRLGTMAERYFKEDPVTCLMKLRQFGELLAQLVAAHVGLYTDADEPQLKLLNRLFDNNLLPGEVKRLFHELRIAGNNATHQRKGNHQIALSNLKYARQLGIWFYRTFSVEKNFNPGAFIPPPEPAQETIALKLELERLRADAQNNRTAAELAQAKASQEEELRQITEDLLREAEAQANDALQRLEQLQTQTASQSNQLIKQTVGKAQIAETQIDLDETETRRLIDAQLRAAGWSADSENLTYNKGTRPEKGRNLAIAEYPTRNGRADYALFVGLEIVALVEAKRQCKDVSAAIDQAKRYSEGYRIRGEENLPDGHPWGEYQVPFVFATNGREFLQQLRTKSGIWFCDLRRPDNLRRPIMTWYNSKGLIKTLSQDSNASHQQLSQETFNYNIELRNYQINAIQTVEASLANNRRELLVAMATGTGKTKTAIVLVYRLLKSKRFRRILFLVDRSALGDRAISF